MLSVKATAVVNPSMVSSASLRCEKSRLMATMKIAPKRSNRPMNARPLLADHGLTCSQALKDLGAVVAFDADLDIHALLGTTLLDHHETAAFEGADRLHRQPQGVSLA